MEQIKLKKEVLDFVKSNPTVYGKVSEELGIAPSTLPRLIYAHDARLTQLGILRILGEHLKCSIEELLSETEGNDNTKISELQAHGN